MQVQTPSLSQDSNPSNIEDLTNILLKQKQSQSLIELFYNFFGTFKKNPEKFTPIVYFNALRLPNQNMNSFDDVLRDLILFLFFTNYSSKSEKHFQIIAAYIKQMHSLLVRHDNFSNELHNLTVLEHFVFSIPFLIPKEDVSKSKMKCVKDLKICINYLKEKTEDEEGAFSHEMMVLIEMLLDYLEGFNDKKEIKSNTKTEIKSNDKNSISNNKSNNSNSNSHSNSNNIKTNNINLNLKQIPINSQTSTTINNNGSSNHNKNLHLQQQQKQQQQQQQRLTELSPIYPLRSQKFNNKETHIDNNEQYLFNHLNKEPNFLFFNNKIVDEQNKNDEDSSSMFSRDFSNLLKQCESETGNINLGPMQNNLPIKSRLFPKYQQTYQNTPIQYNTNPYKSNKRSTPTPKNNFIERNKTLLENFYLKYSSQKYGKFSSSTYSDSYGHLETIGSFTLHTIKSKSYNIDLILILHNTNSQNIYLKSKEEIRDWLGGFIATYYHLGYNEKEDENVNQNNIICYDLLDDNLELLTHVNIYLYCNKYKTTNDILKIIFNDESNASLLHAFYRNILTRIGCYNGSEVCFLIIAFLDVKYKIFKLDSDAKRFQNIKYKGNHYKKYEEIYYWELSKEKLDQFEKENDIFRIIISFSEFLQSIFNLAGELPQRLFDHKYLFNIKCIRDSLQQNLKQLIQIKKNIYNFYNNDNDDNEIVFDKFEDIITILVQ